MTFAEWIRTARAYRGSRRRFYWLHIVAFYPEVRRRMARQPQGAE